MNQTIQVMSGASSSCCEVERIGEWFASQRPFEVTVEATASYEWFVQLAEPYAARVILAHPGELRVAAAQLVTDSRRENLPPPQAQGRCGKSCHQDLDQLA